MGVNSLPKTVTRQRRDYDLNPGPSATESSTLTTRLPTRSQWCIGGYTRVYGVYQPPGVFLTAYTHLSDHK